MTIYDFSLNLLPNVAIMLQIKGAIGPGPYAYSALALLKLLKAVDGIWQDVCNEKLTDGWMGFYSKKKMKKKPQKSHRLHHHTTDDGEIDDKLFITFPLYLPLVCRSSASAHLPFANTSSL